MKTLFVTGTPRSGTHYTSLLLRTIGIDCRHETLGPAGMVSWVIAPFDICRYPGVHTVHQVRAPLRAIASLASLSELAAANISTWKYLSEYIDCNQTYPKILRAMKCWYHWNKLVEKCAVYRYRIEDIDTELQKILWQAEMSVPEETTQNALKTIKRNTHTRGARRLRPVQWSDLHNSDADLTDKIKELAVQYGYKPDSSYDDYNPL